MTPSVSLIQELNEEGTIGKVEPFAGNNTRYVTVAPDKLKELAETVEKEYKNEWVTIGLTPSYPLAVYPTEKTPIRVDEGIALAPGLYPDDYQRLMDHRSQEDTE